MYFTANGVLSCIDDIQKYFRMNYGEELEEYSVQMVLQERKAVCRGIYSSHGKTDPVLYRKSVSRIKPEGIPDKAAALSFLLWGSGCFQTYGEVRSNFSFDTDIKANAKGFERLSRELNK